MRRILAPALLLTVLAAGCGRSPAALEPALQARAVQAITGSFGAPLAIRLQHAWLGRDDGMVCGRIDPPPMLRGAHDSLRFYYEDRYHAGQVEFHELIVADTVGGEVLAAQNRSLFNQMWARSCAPDDPARSWLARLTG